MSIDFEKALEGWNENNLCNYTDDCQFLNLLDRILTATKQQTARIRELYSLAKEESEQTEEVQSLIRLYVSESENLFLLERQLVGFMQKEKEPEKTNNLSIYGNWLDKRYSLSKKNDGYLFILPPLISQYKSQRRLNEGKAIYFLVLRLIENFQIRHGLIDIYEDAEITFTHFIDRNTPQAAIPDPDNVDIKKIIDALHGFIIESDNLLHLTLHHEAEISNWAHTQLTIKKKRK